MRGPAGSPNAFSQDPPTTLALSQDIVITQTVKRGPLVFPTTNLSQDSAMPLLKPGQRMTVPGMPSAPTIVGGSSILATKFN